jgi:hypothetical protein
MLRTLTRPALAEVERRRAGQLQAKRHRKSNREGGGHGQRCRRRKASKDKPAATDAGIPHGQRRAKR